MKETEIQASILSYLERRSIWAWRMNSRVVMMPGKGGQERPVRMGGMKGMADIIGILPASHGGGGRFLAIEVKSAKGKMRPEQIAFQKMVDQAGGVAIVASSAADVHARLEKEMPR